MLFAAFSATADPPGLPYLFPAGGQRGTTVTVRAGGLYLHERCGFALLGPGVDFDRELKRTNTIFFEGPILPLPDSQRVENYPQDMLAAVRIAANAPLGKRNALAWTAEGGASGPVFVVGDLPEVVEKERPGDAVAEPVSLPVTINGRIFPREDVDEWSFTLRAGEVLTAEAVAEKIGTPLQVRLEALDAAGRRLAESDSPAGAVDARLRFTAEAAGTYRIRIFDARYFGGPDFVYRLTLSTGPHVDAVYPLGGRRGSTTAFQLLGAKTPQSAMPLAIPADAPREFSHSFVIDGKRTPPVHIDLDDLVELRESEPNEVMNGREAPPLPFVANGRIDRPGDVDTWPVQLQKGKSYEFEIRARRLDSPLQPVLTLSDAKGKELARSDPLEQNGIDPKINYTAPADGTYWLSVRDHFRSRGGPEFAYRLCCTEAGAAAPDFRVTFKQAVIAVERGKSIVVKCECQRLGSFTAPVEVQIDGLPKGVTAKPITIGPKDRNLDLRIEAVADALLQGTLIRLTASAQVGGKRVAKFAEMEPAGHLAKSDQALFVVTTKTPFVLKSDFLLTQAPRGTVFRKRYRVERNGFTGPLEVRLADRQARHLQGVTGPVLTIRPDQNEFDYPISMPPWMETGRTCRVCIMATGRIRDRDGTEHAVSYSSVEQNMQMIVVMEPGKLGLELERSSVAVKAGAAVSIQVKVARGAGLAGPVKVELAPPREWRGIQADAITVPADKSTAVLTLRFANDVHGPFTSPALVRATLLESGDPVIAEANLELVGK